MVKANAKTKRLTTTTIIMMIINNIASKMVLIYTLKSKASSKKSTLKEANKLPVYNSKQPLQSGDGYNSPVLKEIFAMTSIQGIQFEMEGNE